MRIGVEATFRIRNADFLHQVDRERASTRSADAIPAPGDLSDLIADPLDRIEPRHRILEDHRDIPRWPSGPHWRTAEGHGTRGDGRRWREHAGDGAKQRALPAARFADDANDLAGRDGERHVADRPGRSEPGVDGDREAVDVQQRSGHPSSIHWAMPLPMSASAAPITTTASPGAIESNGRSPMNCCPSAMRLPSSGVGGAIPSPR